MVLLLALIPAFSPGEKEKRSQRLEESSRLGSRETLAKPGVFQL
jgi:hypothetical protein